MTQSVILVHAPADLAFARQLAGFLDLGCDVHCDLEAGRISPGDDLLDLVEQLQDPLVVLLSKDSWPDRIPRERWEPVLLARPLAFVLVGACPYPALLERRTFFDHTAAKENRHLAPRGLKRWLWQQQSATRVSPRYTWSPDLEHLYAELADKPGGLAVAESGEQARRFAREAVGEFESVIWVPCHERSLVEAMGNLSEQLGLTLDGEEPQNRSHIHNFFANHRCLIVLDAPSDEVRSALDVTGGRSSTLITKEPVEILETPLTFDYARQLVRSQRLAEAYELLCALLNSGEAERSHCAQELVSICEHWGRTGEAASLRQFDEAPTQQMGLFD